MKAVLINRKTGFRRDLWVPILEDTFTIATVPPLTAYTSASGWGSSTPYELPVVERTVYHIACSAVSNPKWLQRYSIEEGTALYLEQ